jgi:RNA polymerase sigma factor (sigma-70 family)
MKSPNYTDADLIEKIRSGDKMSRNAALRYLYDDPSVLTTVRGFVRDYHFRADADDVLQEAMILLDEMLRAGSFRGQSSLRTFLIGICKNLLRNKVRAAEKIKLTDDINDSDQIAGGIERDANPEDQFIIEETDAAAQTRDSILRGLLTDLTERCRDILNLYYFQAYTMAQVAAERGLANANRAANAAQDCRQQLRQRIAEQPNLMTYLKAGL